MHRTGSKEQWVNDIESVWLKQALHGDDEAFSQLVESYQRPVFNLCYRMLGEAQDAEDAAQEAFWRAYQNLKRYDTQRSFVTWLLSIAAHYCIDQQRKKRLVSFSIDEIEEVPITDNAPNPEKAASKLEERRLIQSLLASMKTEDRAVLILRYWYELSEEEIAQALSATVSSVKSRLHRARLMMAQRWQNAQGHLLLEGDVKYESSTL
jgi:RNA polymerase sigma-70 factor, ECF subfamily